MNTRVSKYSENTDMSMSRVSKNDDLYKRINEEQLDNFSVSSNATVIGPQEQEIDLDKLKSILDKRYNNQPKRKSIRVEPREVESRLDDESTKEYDLKLVLEKAKDEKTEKYDDVRAKKLRNTQFDILNNLNIEEKVEDNDSKENKSSEEDLMDLINTITINEAKKKEENDNNDDDVDPLSILTDLKGSDNSQVYESMAEDIEKALDEVKEVANKEETKKEFINNKPEKFEENKIEHLEEVKKTEKIDSSFYTDSLFKKQDFVNEEDDEGNEFVDDYKMGIGVKILIIVVVLVFAVGLFLFLKSFINF